ncbi:MAG: MBL fold metallo-hydrolase [Acidimicrobiia bacterium]|nr:MBL fold metallo-hydrolase [Acidimicrobiia bacterium]
MHWSDSRVEVHRIVVGPVDNNVFVVRCRTTGEGVLLDAANEHERLLELCQALDVRTVLETHGHWDHIQAVPAVREAGYKVGVTEQDAAMLPSYDYLLTDESVIEIGRLRIHTHHTPGHTPGSMSFSVEDTPLLFTGDTLFPGGPGATSFDGGDFPTILASIEDRMFAVFDPDTIVLPGHGADTTIGTEIPSFDDWVARGW